MNHVLLPVENLHTAKHALDYVITKNRCDPSWVHLLNVQRPIKAGEVTHFHTAEMIMGARKAAGADVLRSVQRLLEAKGVGYTARIVVGETAETIARYAAEKGCTSIVMGGAYSASSQVRRRQSALAQLLLSRRRWPTQPESAKPDGLLPDRARHREETWMFHLHRGDYSRWFRHCIRDDYLADEAQRVECRADLEPWQTRPDDSGVDQRTVHLARMSNDCSDVSTCGDGNT